MSDPNSSPSGIPVGSPPAPPGRHAAPGGWYPDPVDLRFERYWDGWQWTRNTRAIEATPPPTPYAGFASPTPAMADQARDVQQNFPGGYRPAPPAGGVLTADGVRVSGWWWRVLAVVLDNLITGVLIAIIASPIYLRLIQALSAYFNEAFAAASAGQPTPDPPEVTELLPVADQVLLTLIATSVALAYAIFFLRWKGATPGKLITGLRVVPVDQGRFAGKLGWGPIVIRSLIWVVPGSYAGLIVITIADALFPLWHSKRQALHDLAAKTQVVKIN